MKHEEFIEKYASIMEREDFLSVQIQRAEGNMDDSIYLEKLMDFGVSREDALGYMEADKQLNVLLEESKIFNDLEAVTLLMMHDLENVAELRRDAANDPSLVRRQFILHHGMSDEDAEKVIDYLLRPE